MTPGWAFPLFSLLAAVFGILYFPMLNRLARGLASPYAKADLTRRIQATAVDMSLVMICIVAFRTQGSPLFLVAGGTYALLRDWLFVKGQSIGKFLVGLVVINLDNGKPAGLLASAKRNAIFVVPGLNVVAIGLEMLSIVQDRQGQRLGDRIANTQVVEGLGAKEFVRSLQESMLEIEMKSRVDERPVKVE
jgi:uncharacterized RDD family membrane protein YckC